VIKLFFVLLGVLLAIYVVSCVLGGSVVVKAGLGRRTYQREAQPNMFWLSVGIYAALAIALMTIF